MLESRIRTDNIYFYCLSNTASYQYHNLTITFLKRTVSPFTYKNELICLLTLTNNSKLSRMNFIKFDIVIFHSFELASHYIQL